MDINENHEISEVKSLLKEFSKAEKVEVPTKNHDADEPIKSSPSLRMKYQAERGVIAKKLGNIEDIREELGLSKRKICQLLLVDPSSWTRWSKPEEDAPPYIYRSLQWYLALIDKNPEWHPANTWLGQNSLHQELKDELDRLDSKQSLELQGLQSELQQMKDEKKHFVKKIKAYAAITFTLLVLALILALIQ